MSQKYENASFFETLDDVGDMLAELAYIDRAKPYLEGLAWVAGLEMYDVELGERHPFMVRITLVGDEAWTRVEQRLRELEGKAAARAEGDVAALVDRLASLVGFDPAGHREAVTQLSSIHDTLLREGTTDLGQLERSLDDWTGSAADAFALDFYQPLELVHANQCYLLRGCCTAMAGAIGTVETGQNAAMNAVLAAEQALDDQLRARAQGDSGPTSRDFLTIAAAATGVVNTLRFGHPPSAAALSLVIIGAGLAKEFVIGDEGVHETATIEASTAEEVAEALHREVGRVLSRTDLALTHLNGEVARIRAEMVGMLDDRRLHPPRPALAADTSSTALHFQFGGS